MTKFVTAFVCFAFTLSSPAYGQSDFWAGVTADVISQAVGDAVSGGYESRCLAGQVRSPWMPQIERIRESTQGSMVRYFERVRAAEPADVSDLFSRRYGLWRQIAEQQKDQDLQTVSDPLAQVDTAALSEPDQLFPSVDGETVTGLWTVRDASNADQVVGHYRAGFRREHRRWKLALLEVGGPDDDLSLTPYCHVLGDIDAYIAARSAAPKDSANPDLADQNPAVVPPSAP